MSGLKPRDFKKHPYVTMTNVVFPLYFILIASYAILSGGLLLPHYNSVSIDLGELAMLEVITA